jgi:anti-sigma regulatory factor (Ser/Thr protein kinase)
MRTYAVGQVVVLEPAFPLGDVVDDLDYATKLALAEGPRGIVFDLSAAPEGSEASAVDLLANVGRHVRDWPGVPIAVACPDPRVREALAAHPLGRYLLVTEAILGALSAVLWTRIPVVESLHLAPQPSSSRASRDFVTRALLDWQLPEIIPATTLVVSELVTNSTVHAGTEIDLSVAWDRQVLRLTVRDHSPGLPRPRPRRAGLAVHGRGLTIVAGLCRAFGSLPCADGGKVVWAVLEVPPAKPGNQALPCDPAAATKEPPPRPTVTGRFPG